MQVVLVYLQQFRRNLLLKCAPRTKIANKITNGSKSFKVIDVDGFEKPVASACHDMQQVCTYLQPFSHYMSQ